MMERKWTKIWTVVKVIVVFTFFITLPALDSFFPQYPQSTFSIIKVSSPSVWPKGDRPTGQQHLFACVPLVILGFEHTCWDSQSPPISALEKCPHWLLRAEQAYCPLICLESQVQPHPSWLHSGPPWCYLPSLHFFSLHTHTHTHKRLIWKAFWKVRVERQPGEFRVAPLPILLTTHSSVLEIFVCYLNFTLHDLWS